jgi:hypothetical protein
MLLPSSQADPYGSAASEAHIPTNYYTLPEKIVENISPFTISRQENSSLLFISSKNVL